MNLKSVIVKLVWITAFLVISYLIGEVTRQNMDWYADLNKSPFNPPRLAFPIVWSILYTMLAIVGAQLWMNRAQVNGKKHMIVYAAYMLVNWAWSFIFFGAHMVGIGFAWIILADIILAALIFLLYKSEQKLQLMMLLPTLLWGLFAAYLNGYIYLAG